MPRTPLTSEAAITTFEEKLGTLASARFPLRTAALDVGSNAIRFLVAEFSDAERFSALEAERLPVRLGHDAFTSGILSEASQDAALAAAVRFREELDRFGVAYYRAVATSAVRESRNGGELVDRIRRESGVRLETITGSEEARLVWLAVRHRMGLGDRPWILADLGGGSMEVSLVTESGIHWSQSHPVGTVRLLEDFGAGQVQGQDLLELLEHFTSRLSLPEEALGTIEGAIITGGNAEALADLIRPGGVSNAPTELTRQELRAVLDRLAALTVAERIERLGLRPDRADVILPAAIVYHRVATLAATERIVVPRVGVREGVLYDMVGDLAEHRAHETELDRTTLAAAIVLGRRYRFDEEHARHVADLALSLFDQLQPLHGLGEVSKRHLAAAALLHDIGQFVSYRRHHKHSWYLVTHSDLPGLTPRETRLVALITRYHRRSVPKPYHEGYADLNDEEREQVGKLSAILRIADALDREHQRRVKRVTASIRDGKVALRLEVQGTAPLENWSLKKKAGFFETTFDVELQVA